VGTGNGKGSCGVAWRQRELGAASVTAAAEVGTGAAYGRNGKEGGDADDDSVNEEVADGATGNDATGAGTKAAAAVAPAAEPKQGGSAYAPAPSDVGGGTPTAAVAAAAAAVAVVDTPVVAKGCAGEAAVRTAAVLKGERLVMVLLLVVVLANGGGGNDDDGNDCDPTGARTRGGRRREATSSDGITADVPSARNATRIPAGTARSTTAGHQEELKYTSTFLRSTAVDSTADDNSPVPAAAGLIEDGGIGVAGAETAPIAVVGEAAMPAVGALPAGTHITSAAEAAAAATAAAAAAVAAASCLAASFALFSSRRFCAFTFAAAAAVNSLQVGSCGLG